jgi:1-acyl-sn-glycerol-3-phosphate acyltransferase
MSLLRTTPNEHRLPTSTRLTAGDGLRILRSAVFVVVYLLYLILFMGFVQRFILIPLALLFPVQTTRFLGSWSRLQARVSLLFLRRLARVKVTYRGEIPPQNRVVIMNHQSVLDVLIGVRINPGDLMLIPTRRRYAWGVPGFSPFVRLAGYPLISQDRKRIRQDLAELEAAAERCRRGEASFLVYPEGHRSKDGSIQPFMTRGLRVVLSRAPLPVYCVVADGMWHVRTLKDLFTKVGGSHIQARVIGPYPPPSDEAEIPAFLDNVRQQMILTLDAMRSGSDRHTSPAVRHDL